MQSSVSLDHAAFLQQSRDDAVNVTVEPRLADSVLRSKLMPARFKARFLQHPECSAADIVVDYALESELFYDIMVDVGVLQVHEAA